MGLLSPRPTYAPFEYDQAYKYWELQQQSHWLPNEISMASDINDWKVNLNENEKNIVGHILKGFTQSEVFIQEYWGGQVSKWFKKPEIQMMAAAFASMESVHAVSYALLNQSLGLEDFEAFLYEPTAKAKIDRLINSRGRSKSDIAKSLAVFSAFNEGVNLFSSFAVLLNFSRFNKLKGLGQIIAFSIKDECCSDDTEVLTPKGWVSFPELKDTDEVCQFDPEDSSLSFVKPSRIIKKHYNGKMYHFSSEKKHIDITVTPNHRMPFRWANKSKTSWDFENASEFKTRSPQKVMPVAGFKNSGSKESLTPHERFLVALQADGRILGANTCEFNFSKKRKLDRFREILSLVGYSYKESNKKNSGNSKDSIVFKVKVPLEKILSKKFDWIDLKSININWASQFLEELVEWDGYKPKKSSGNYIYYSSTDLDCTEIVQAIASFCGRAAIQTVEKDDRSETYSDVYRVYIHDRCDKRLGLVDKREVDYDGDVYCVTVPTGAFLVRRNGVVQVTGNCLHSEAGCWLFNTLVQENPEIMTKEFKEELYDAARTTVELEDNFIDKAFSVGDVEGISAADVKAFIRFRTNTKLNDIGLKKLWKKIDKDCLDRMEWFDILSAGVSHADFFAQRVTDYSRGSLDFSGIWDDK